MDMSPAVQPIRQRNVLVDAVFQVVGSDQKRPDVIGSADAVVLLP